ncbi:hypothetical protein ACFFRR_009843 [Megaselia abdita]
MKERKLYLLKKCHDNGLDVIGNDTLHKPNAWEYLVNRKHHIIWCNIFKAASSSWMYNFNVLSGYTPEFLKQTKAVPLMLARKKYPRLSVEKLREAQRDSITFLIARNPYERLLSAYRDKFMFAVPNSFHDKLGRKIINKFRKNDERTRPRYPTFSEFVSWFLEEIRLNNYIDMHLVPATSFCTPCLINIDIIVKFESLNEDQLYLIEKANLSSKIFPEWKNSGRGSKSTVELLQSFYDQLTDDQKARLYHYYKYDFEIFDYQFAV